MLTALAGTPLAAVERELASRAQRLAFEPPDFGALLGALGRARSAECSLRTSRDRDACRPARRAIISSAARPSQDAASVSKPAAAS